MVNFDILKSDLNAVHHGAFNYKYFRICSKINRWQLHKNRTLRHSERCSQFNTLPFVKDIL